MAEAPSWCWLVSAEVEEQTCTSWWETWWPVYATGMRSLTSTSDRTLVQSDPSSYSWTTLDLIVPGRLKTTSSRTPSTVCTGQHAHLISARSSMFGTCYRWWFHDVRSSTLTWSQPDRACLERATGGDFTMSGPARSPDLSPIEHVWNELQVAISRCLVQPAHLISARSSMFGTSYRWRFHDVRSSTLT